MFDPERRAERRRLKEQERAVKERERQVVRQEAAAKQKAARESEAVRQRKELEHFGRLVSEGAFALKTVRIYSRGYVKIAPLMFGGGATYERLISIEFSGDVQKKTGPGRVGAAVLTGGANLLLTPNKRGDVYLTIATDRRTHVLREDPPNFLNIRIARQLAAAGQSVLLQLQAESARPDPAPPIRQSRPVSAPPADDRMRELEKLHRLLKQLEAKAASRPVTEAHTTGARPSAAALTPSESKSVTERLQELVKLHDLSMVSDTEFHELRSKLLKDL